MRALSFGDERGAATVVIVVLFSAGVFFASLALVVDVGMDYLEKRVVQTAADAAVMVAAADCVSQNLSCASSQASISKLQGIVNSNSPDGVSKIGEVCGKSPLSGCSVSPSTALTCKNLPSFPSFVRVRVATLTTEGSSVLPGVFAPLLVSSTPPSKIGLNGCAQAWFGAAKDIRVSIPVVLPVCNFREGTQVLFQEFLSSDPVQGCTVNTVEGPRTFSNSLKGFGFINQISSDVDCLKPSRVVVGSTYARQPATVQLCNSQIVTRLTEVLNKPIFLPIISQVTDTGQGNFTFTVSSFARLTLIGFKISNRSGGVAPSSGWLASNCGASTSCLYGEFRRGIVPGSLVTTDPTTPNLGALAIQMVP